MNVLHVTLSPLAGAPIRIVSAINSFDKIFKSRLVNFSPNQYGPRVFDEDLTWERDKEECLHLIANADIIHMHHFFSYDSDRNPFRINFKKIARDQCLFLRQYHSEPNYLAKKLKISLDEIIKPDIPSMVIAQFHERYYLNSIVVPNIVPIDNPVYMPSQNVDSSVGLFFSSTSENSLFEQRWETKGRPEVENILKKIAHQASVEFTAVKDMPFLDCMKLKQKSVVVIDDIITGSYHLTGLEGLSQGKPVFTFLDQSSILSLIKITSATHIPFINVDISNIKKPLTEILQNKELALEIGKNSRDWMNKFYRPENLIQHYTNSYKTLLNGERLGRKYDEHEAAKVFLSVKVPDYLFNERNKKLLLHPRFFFIFMEKKVSLYLRAIKKRMKTLFL